MEPDHLKSIPLFQTVSDDELAQIAPFAEEVRVDAGTQLVREGDFSYDFFAIEEGEAEVTRGGDHVADLGPGDFFGEIGLLEAERRTATVVATSPMRLIVIFGPQLRSMEREMPELSAQLRQTIRDRLGGGPQDS